MVDSLMQDFAVVPDHCKDLTAIFGPAIYTHSFKMLVEDYYIHIPYYHQPKLKVLADCQIILH